MEKLFLMFQEIDLKILEKFGQQEGHHFEFQSLGVWKFKKKQKEDMAHLSVSDTV
jgi:hypothetical protein